MQHTRRFGWYRSAAPLRSSSNSLTIRGQWHRAPRYPRGAGIHGSWNAHVHVPGKQSHVAKRSEKAGRQAENARKNRPARLLTRDRLIHALFGWSEAFVVFVLITLLLTAPALVLLSQSEGEVREPWPGLPCIVGIMQAGLVLAVFSTYFVVPLTVGRAKPVHDPAILQAVREVSKRAGWRSPPKLMCVDTQEVNAMAYSSLVGPRVVLTQGLVDACRSSRFSLVELKAIIGHEIGHHISLDTLKREIVFSGLVIMRAAGCVMVTIGVALCAAATDGHQSKRQSRKRGHDSGGAALLMAGSGFACIGTGFLMQLLVKLVSLVAFYQSRRLEYDADEIGARLTSPRLMAGALLKMYNLSSNLSATGRAFLPQAEKWQLQPLGAGWVERLFDTHPPLEKRIERLLALEQNNGQKSS